MKNHSIDPGFMSDVSQALIRGVMVQVLREIEEQKKLVPNGQPDKKR